MNVMKKKSGVGGEGEKERGESRKKIGVDVKKERKPGKS